MMMFRRQLRSEACSASPSIVPLAFFLLALALNMAVLQGATQSLKQGALGVAAGVGFFGARCNQTANADFMDFDLLFSGAKGKTLQPASPPSNGKHWAHAPRRATLGSAGSL
ncbi:hypothetical protein T484DRAFT_1875150 [Baffinella frigidus]|nr:hypothetical protein T484DRAFT_1875150 [Cryptophyta sp. CCMP2293]|mmetsp:Transcript_22699/g.54343  ORF Transcript_22699/g.54343 Transcript_22699/m.54343 type:complete len:112 (+) Transcript_22699:230-565(+)